MVEGVSAVAMQESSTRSIYDFHSMFYDVTFSKLVRRRIAKAISHMNIPAGARVLDRLNPGQSSQTLTGYGMETCPVVGPFNENREPWRAEINPYLLIR